ncbi:FUSC family protein [Actinomycetospora sp. NBRC 106375]|uniref:FUSC family protein n=1 Tax=Actinomycetospora sp. NBRC 106375 TaxID=3032207 RepID=UPI00255515E9|nr:FUSC family protein [Actinomycetospora sp. NBRC 106375]
MQLSGAGATMREWWHRLVASDPGLVRLTSAGRATVGVGSALLVELAVVRLLGLPSALVPMMLGGVIAMMAAFGVSDPTRAGRAATLGVMSLFLLGGMGTALLVDRVRVLSLVTFVLVMMLAVVIRRFGPRYFIGGMVTFMGYFFALFLGLRPEQVPGILLAVAVGFAWATFLSLVVLPVRHDRVLRRTVRAFSARVQRAVAATGEMLDAPGDERRRDRVHDRLVAVTEAALMLDGQLGIAVAADAHARAVRHAVIDGELATRAVVDAAHRLAERPGGGTEVRDLLGLVGAGRWEEARAAADGARATHADGEAAVAAVGALVAVRDAWSAAVAGERGTAESAETGDFPEFAPAVELFGGFLPGSGVTVMAMRDAVVDGSASPRSWASHLALPTRQALQVGLATALAVALGDVVSGQRWYWAVLAAFLAFTGTATAAETVRKAGHRIVGTMVGLVGAIPLVALTGGSPAVAVPVMLLSVFLGFYLFKVSYALMIFFITLLVGELYALLGSFTPSLMLLRLGETVLGGVIGAAVAFLVVPTHARDAVSGARRVLLERLTTLLDDVDVWLRRPDMAVDLGADARSLDAAVHQMLTVTDPLTRTLLVVPDRDTRRRMTGWTTVAYHAARLARAARAVPRGRGSDGGGAHRLARLAERWGAEDPRTPRAATRAVGDLLAHADRTGRPGDPVVRELLSLHEAVTALADARGFLGDRADDDPGVRGRVLDADLAPASATVTLVDRDGTGGTPVATDADGVYATGTTPGGQLVVVPGRGLDAGPTALRLPRDGAAVLPDVVLPRRRELPRAAPPHRVPAAVV